MAKKQNLEPKKKIEWEPFLERCCCGSGNIGELIMNDEGKILGYFCEECEQRRLRTFGIIKGDKK